MMGRPLPLTEYCPRGALRDPFHGIMYVHYKGHCLSNNTLIKEAMAEVDRMEDAQERRNNPVRREDFFA